VIIISDLGSARCLVRERTNSDASKQDVAQELLNRRDSGARSVDDESSVNNSRLAEEKHDYDSDIESLHEITALKQIDMDFV
jgi:hypothetical protein